MPDELCLHLVLIMYENRHKSFSKGRITKRYACPEKSILPGFSDVVIS